MNLLEKFHSLDSDVTECISFVNFDRDGISLSPSGKRLVIDHSTEGLDKEQHRQFHESMISMGFKEDEWLLLHANLKTKPQKTLNEYLFEELKIIELSETLSEFLNLTDDKGKTLQLSKLFDELGRIKNGRAEIVTIGKNWVKRYGKEIDY